MKNLISTFTFLLLFCAPHIGFTQHNPALTSSLRQTPLSVQERTDSIDFLIDYQFDAWNPWSCTYPEITQTYEYDNLNRKILDDYHIYEFYSGILHSRDLFYYGINGKTTLVISGYVNSDSVFTSYSQSVYFYDANNYLTQRLDQNILGVSYARYLYTNNADGEVLETRYETLDATGNWQLRVSVQYTRNSNNQILSSETIHYLNDGITFSFGKRINTTYDSNGRQVYNYVEEWDKNMNIWLPKSQETTAYNTNGQVTTKEYYVPKSANLMELRLKNKFNWVYSNAGLIDTLHTLTWNDTTLSDYARTLFQYENERLTKDSTFKWNLNQWQLFTRSFYVPATDLYGLYFGSYDSIMIQNKDLNTNTWHTDTLKTAQYTVLDNGSIEYNFRLWEFDSFDFKELRLRETSIMRMHRISPVSTNQALTNQSTTLAPNPYKTGQTIRCIGLENSTNLTFSLYDIAGVLISEQTFDGGTGLVLPAEVKAGMYIAVISQGAQRLKSTKIVAVDAL